MTDIDRIIEIEHRWAAAEREIVEGVRRLDPSWGSMTFTVADGWAVLAGPGLFTNCLLGAGLTTELTADDLAHLEEHADEVGVAAAVHICEASRTGVELLAVERGYEPDSVAQAVVHELTDVPEPADVIDVEFITPDTLTVWQEATAAGWGHVEARGRAASDVYAAAAAEVDRPGLLLARSSADGRVVGAAMLRIDAGFATLGGMSTLPAERSNGVQRALIAHRLRLAAEAGCRYAASVAMAGSGSLRNLLRLGFVPSHTKTLWMKR